jgi:hypothetical protein
MTTLDIDRLRAHYHDIDPARLQLLDDALRELVDHVLEDELAGSDLQGGSLAGVLASAWALCIDELTVDVDLDTNWSTRNVASSWAQAILAAVAGSIEGSEGMVVYRREADALTDFVTAVARGDVSRLWAWQQVGLVGPRVLRPTPADVAAAALARPLLTPAVIAAAGPACRAVFRAEDWVRLAREIAVQVGSAPWQPNDGASLTPDPAGAPGAARRAQSSDSPVRPTGQPRPADAAAAVVPDAVWTLTAEARDRWYLAVLCLAVAHPHLTRDRSAIAAILDAAPIPRHAIDHRERTRQTDRPTARDSAPVPEASDDAEPEPSAAPIEPDDPDRPTDDDPLTSAWGGVWFLTHPLLEIEVVDGLSAGPVGPSDALDALSAIVVAVTGAPLDDPSVLGVAGRLGEVPVCAWAPTALQQQEVERWAAAITTWLTERAHGRIATRIAHGPDDDRSLWRRTVTIDASPGWIEVTSSLSDVDIDIRVAGLDIDPGFVWWLGAVVGFRYV